MRTKKPIFEGFGKDLYTEMFKLFDPSRIVSVYRNLHNGKWSVSQSNRVVCHADYIMLRDVRFTVRPAGRLKVLKEKKKNVHAFVKGYLVEYPYKIDIEDLGKWVSITYNPYKYDSFKIINEGMKSIYKAKYVDMFLEKSEITPPVIAMV